MLQVSITVCGSLNKTNATCSILMCLRREGMVSYWCLVHCVKTKKKDQYLQKIDALMLHQEYQLEDFSHVAIHVSFRGAS